MESRVNPPRPLGKPEYTCLTDSVPVPWGKGEKHPGRGVKEFLKPCAYEPSEPPCGVTACLSKNESASQWHVASLSRGGGGVAKASLKRRRESRVLDPKRDDLALGRLKRG